MSLHFVHPPGHVEELAQLPKWLDDQAEEAHRGQELSEDLQSIRLQHFVQKHANGQNDHPAVNDRCDCIAPKEKSVLLRQEWVIRLLQAQTHANHETLQDFSRLLTKIGNLREVHHDVVAVESQKGIPVEDQRADRTDEHDAQTYVIQEPRLAEPPQERGDGCQCEFYPHASSADHRPMPLIGQHPRVGHIAV